MPVLEARTRHIHPEGPQRIATVDNLMSSLLAGAHEKIMPTGMRTSVYATDSKATTSFKNDPGELRQRILNMNNADYYKDIFLTPGLKENGTYVHEVVGDTFSLSEPTSAYGEIDVLGVGATEDVLHNGLPEVDKSGMPVPLLWTELSDETKFRYVTSQMYLLQEMHKDVTGQNQKGSRKKAIIMENSASAIAPATSQSIGLPHFHATIHNLNNFVPTEEKVPNMEDEQRVMQDRELGDRVIGVLDRTAKAVLEHKGMPTEGFTIAQRQTAPYGFTVVFGGEQGINIDNMTDPENLQRILALKEGIHRGYSWIAKRLAGQPGAQEELTKRYGIDDPKEITRQPSVRILTDITSKGDLRLTFAPFVQSRGGPVEVFENILDRRNDPALLNDGPLTTTDQYREYIEATSDFLEIVDNYDPKINN